MSALFGGVENFTPAFTGRQLAMQSGQGAGQSISRGMAMAQRGDALQLEKDKFTLEKDKYNQMIERLKLFKIWLDTNVGD